MDADGLPPEAPPSEAISAERVRALARQMDLELAPSAGAALAAYAALLQHWNKVYNLTAIRGEHELLTHHLLDSLAIVRPLEHALADAGLPTADVRLLDAGSGAGLPGIPIALARPDWQLTLVDAVRKKCAFLRQAQVELGLPNVQVLHARLETLPAEPGFDVIVARALGSLRELVERTRHALRPGGLWAVMKGRRPDDELGDVPPAVTLVGISKLRVPLLAQERHLALLRAPGRARCAAPGHETRERSARGAR